MGTTDSFSNKQNLYFGSYATFGVLSNVCLIYYLIGVKNEAADSVLLSLAYFVLPTVVMACFSMANLFESLLFEKMALISLSLLFCFHLSYILLFLSSLDHGLTINYHMVSIVALTLFIPSYLWDYIIPWIVGKCPFATLSDINLKQIISQLGLKLITGANLTISSHNLATKKNVEYVCRQFDETMARIQAAPDEEAKRSEVMNFMQSIESTPTSMYPGNAGYLWLDNFNIKLDMLQLCQNTFEFEQKYNKSARIDSGMPGAAERRTKRTIKPFSLFPVPTVLNQVVSIVLAIYLLGMNVCELMEPESSVWFGTFAKFLTFDKVQDWKVVFDASDRVNATHIPLIVGHVEAYVNDSNQNITILLTDLLLSNW